MGYDAIHTPHSIESSWTILVPVHIDPLNLHGPGRSKRGVFPAILASGLVMYPAVVVHIIVSVENPIIFIRLGITKRGYPRRTVIGKESGQLGVYPRQLREV